MTELPDIPVPDRQEPVVLAWPDPSNPGAFLRFERADEWRAFISVLGINPQIPEPVQIKFARAQMLYLVAWLDFSLVKAGELAAPIALELALMDQYGGQRPKRDRGFGAQIKHMVAADGLAHADIPIVARCGGTAIGQLTGDIHPALAERRNLLAHGDPFDGLPTGAMLVLVRDLINYAYRAYRPHGAPL